MPKIKTSIRQIGFWIVKTVLGRLIGSLVTYSLISTQLSENWGALNQLLQLEVVLPEARLTVRDLLYLAMVIPITIIIIRKTIQLIRKSYYWIYIDVVKFKAYYKPIDDNFIDEIPYCKLHNRQFYPELLEGGIENFFCYECEKPTLLSRPFDYVKQAAITTAKAIYDKHFKRTPNIKIRRF